MKRFKFILKVLAMILFVRPHRWQYEYKRIKEQHKNPDY